MLIAIIGGDCILMQSPLFGEMKHAERSVGSAFQCSFYIEAAMRMCYNTVKGAGESPAHIGEVL